MNEHEDSHDGAILNTDVKLPPADTTPMADALVEAGIDPQKVGAAIVGSSQWAGLIREIADKVQEMRRSDYHESTPEMKDVFIFAMVRVGVEEKFLQAEDGMMAIVTDAVRSEIERRQG